MITRTQVRQFLAVVDGGSFTRAAQLIHVTQPTLSTGISELEKHLGTKLFIREKRRIQLTEAGTRFLPRARRIQREFRLAEDETATSQNPAEPIILGVLESFSSKMLEDIVAAYQSSGRERPLHLFEGKEAELAGALLSGQIDAALSIYVPSSDLPENIVLFEEPYLLMVGTEHPVAGQQIVAPESVSNETMMARRSCEILAETSKYFTSHGARPPFSLRSPHDDRVMQMVRAGLGITVAPASLIIEGVAAVPLEGFYHRRTIGLIFGKNWRESFIDGDFLIQIVETHAKLRGPD